VAKKRVERLIGCSDFVFFFTFLQWAGKVYAAAAEK
jgi:hypothetical protein